MAGTLAPNLYAIIDDLENNRAAIAAEWIEIETVKAVFSQYHISGKKFAEGYGIPIIEYFSSVVREDKLMGDCPIMSKLVHFLLAKDITPKDVFDICMGLRQTLVDFLFREGLMHKPREMMAEIAYLFNANLSGVMGIFGETYAKRQERILQLEMHDQKFKQILKIINFIKTKIIIAEEGEIVLANQPFFDTVGVGNLKSFQEKYPDNWSFVSSVDVENELFQGDRSKWLQVIHKSDRPFKAQIHHALAKKSLTYSGRITVLPDTEPTQYIMTLNNIALHIADEEQQLDKLYRDPMTGLFNYARFEQLLTQAQKEAREHEQELALTVVDFPELNEIAHSQGREAADTMIMEMAQEIMFHCSESMVVARLEGSRFGILRSYETEQECYDWAMAMLERLKKSAGRKQIALTGFDLAEGTHRLMMRAFDLVEMAISLDDTKVRTDFENVDTDVLPDQKPFLEAIKRARRLETTLYYKELPIAGTNPLMSLSDAHVVIRLPVKQRSVAKPEARIYFDLHDVGHVKARIESIDFEASQAKIKEFRTDVHSPLARKKFRVCLPHQLRVNILHKDYAIEGVGLDINDSCVAIDLQRKKSLDEGSLVRLSMMLPTDDDVVALEVGASVQRIEKTPRGYKIVFIMKLGGNDEAVVNQYLVQRQMELIQEIRRGEV